MQYFDILNATLGISFNNISKCSLQHQENVEKIEMLPYPATSQTRRKE
jgi:hypothetical protein